MSGVIELFEAGSLLNTMAGKYSRHRDLVRAGLVRSREVLGFSFELANGEISAFYRTSILNVDCDDFALSLDMMRDVLAALRLSQAARFRSFP